jgi:hypothetical protein
MTNASWRDDKLEKIAIKKAKEEKKRVAVFKEHARVRCVIAEAVKLPELDDACKLMELTIPQLMLFIEMRTCKKCATQKGKAIYLAEATALFDVDCRLATGSVPEGFAAWEVSHSAVE